VANLPGENGKICPFCEEGTLEKHVCKKCGKAFYLCDECGSVYRDLKSTDELYPAEECPHCGSGIS